MHYGCSSAYQLSTHIYHHSSDAQAVRRHNQGCPTDRSVHPTSTVDRKARLTPFSIARLIVRVLIGAGIEGHMPNMLRIGAWSVRPHHPPSLKFGTLQRCYTVTVHSIPTAFSKAAIVIVIRCCYIVALRLKTSERKRTTAQSHYHRFQKSKMELQKRQGTLS